MVVIKGVFGGERLRGKRGWVRRVLFLLGAAPENEGAAPRYLGDQFPRFLSFFMESS